MIKKQTTTKLASSMVSNHESNYIKFKFHKDRVIHDGEKSVLVYIADAINLKGAAVWIAKKLLYKYEWSNYISASIPDGFTFQVENTDGVKELSVAKLKEYIEIKLDNL